MEESAATIQTTKSVMWRIARRRYKRQREYGNDGEYIGGDDTNDKECDGEYIGGDDANDKECDGEYSGETIKTTKSVMGNILGLTMQMQRVWRGRKWG